MTADVESPPIIVAHKPRRKRRLLRFALWLTGGLIVLWIAAFLHATWSLNRAIAALKARGEPSTFEEALARNIANDQPTTGAPNLRQALAESARIGPRLYSTYDLVTPFGGTPNPLDPAPRKEIEERLLLGEKLIPLLEAAVALPPGSLTTAGAKTPCDGPKFKDAADSRKLAMYLAADARFSALIGDSRRAFKRLKLLYTMTEQLAAEEFLLPQRVRLTLVSLGSRTAKRMLSTTDLSVDELTELAELVVRVERNMKLAPCLINERAAVASFLDAPDRLAEELQNTAESRLAPIKASSRLWTTSDSWWIELVTSPFGLPARRRIAAQTLQVPNEVLVLADTPPRWTREAERLFNVWSPFFSVDRVTLNPNAEDNLHAATYIARRIRRELAMMEMAFRLRRFELLHGKLPDRLDELIEPKFPELPTKWFEGKPFVYSKQGRAFTLKANPEVKAEVELPDDNHRDAWGMLLNVDAPMSHAGEKSNPNSSPRSP